MRFRRIARLLAVVGSTVTVLGSCVGEDPDLARPPPDAMPTPNGPNGSNDASTGDAATDVPDASEAGMECSETGKCTSCREHDECPSSACRIATGECFGDKNRLWVSAAAANCATATGSEQAPFCTIDEALATVRNQT